MKRIFTSLFLSILVTGAFAQFNFNTNTNIGQTLKNVKTTDKDTFIVDFSTAKLNSTWAYTTAPAYAMSFQKCQTQKGLQVKGYLDNVTTSEYKIGTTDCNNWGGQRNPIHVESIDSLKAMLIKSPGAASGGNSGDSITRPAACLIDVAGNPAFGLYPGKVKRQEYWFQYNFAGKAVQDDISFDISTLDAGTTGKTATYSLSVATGSESNIVFSKAVFYVTGSGSQAIKLAETMGLNPSVFSDKKVYIKINTLGTSNSLDVVDGVAHGVDASNQPLAYDPMIVFDNFYVTYITPQWELPVAIANDTKDNAANPSIGVIGVESLYSFNLKTKGRIGTFSIWHDLADVGYSAGTRPYTMLETGGIKGKDANGNYNVDIPYTYTAPVFNTDLGTWSRPSYVIAAPTSGSVDDDIKVIVKGTLSSAANDKFELNPGVRIWYQLYASPVSQSEYDGILTGVENSLDANCIYSANGRIYIQNTSADITIFNFTGQRIVTVNANEAQKGISVPKGIYLVKTQNARATKVIVR